MSSRLPFYNFHTKSPRYYNIMFDPLFFIILKTVFNLFFICFLPMIFWLFLINKSPLNGYTNYYSWLRIDLETKNYEEIEKVRRNRKVNE